MGRLEGYRNNIGTQGNDDGFLTVRRRHDLPLSHRRTSRPLCTHLVGGAQVDGPDYNRPNGVLI